MKVKTSENVDSGENWINSDCWCHFLICSVSDAPKGRDGNLIANALFECKCEVRASTDAKQVGKKFDLVMKAGDLSHKDRGKFALEKLSRFLFAVGILKQEQAGQEIDFDERQMVGCSFLAFIKGREGDKQVFYDVDGKKFYHIDDEGCNCPRDLTSLKHHPKAFRWMPASASPVIPPPPPVQGLDPDDIQI